MALVKTDYGLVYNDDGSLCTTIRFKFLQGNVKTIKCL